MFKESVARQLEDALDRDCERAFKMAQAMVPALDVIMDNHARATLAAARIYHRHTCECGDFYVCHLPADNCDPNYTCPSCLYQQQDDFFRGGGAI